MDIRQYVNHSCRVLDSSIEPWDAADAKRAPLISTMGRLMQIISFSGGIDSTALALLVPDATLIFCDTHWEFPQLYSHIEKFEKITGRKVVRVTGGSLPDYIKEEKFFPGFKARYCTRLFKIEPMNEYLIKLAPCELMIGLRADEPLRIGNLTDIEGVSIKYPLRGLGFTRNDCVEICKRHSLIPNYPPYMKRGGCKGCYFKSKSEVKAMSVLAPQILDELQDMEESIQDDRSQFFYMFSNIKCSIRDFRKQLPLFDLTEVYENEIVDPDACGLFCNR